MACRAALPVLILVVALAASARAAAAPARQKLPPEAARVASDFVRAFVSNDRGAISRMLPADLASRYGPSPFSQMPVLSKPRVDERAGAIDFEGRSGGGLPAKGTMVLRKVEGNGHTAWRIRQIYWYEKLPAEARQIPDRSQWTVDRAQEPAIRAAALDFLHHWMARHFAELDARVFHWWDIGRKPPRWVSLRGVRLKEPVSSLAGLRVGFVADLRLLRAVPKSVEGNLWLVQEEGAWRVRPLTVAFWF